MNKRSTYIGLIAGIVMIALSIFFFYGLKLPVTGNNQFVIIAVFLAAILLTMFAYKRTNPIQAGIKNYFAEGFKTFVVATLLMAVYTFVFYKLNPQILEAAIIENEVLAAKEGNHTAIEITNNSVKLRNIFMPMMMAITTLKFLILGAVASVVAAAFISPKNNNAVNVKP